MALRATIHKADLHVADSDRHYYGSHSLTIAKHPSETDERMMVRIIAFALQAHEDLVLQWIEVGQPDERRILKACGKSSRVRVYLYASTGPIWWKQTQSKVSRASNLQVFQIDPEVAKALEPLCQRTMQLQVTIQDGEIWVRDATQSVLVAIEQILDDQRQ